MTTTLVLAGILLVAIWFIARQARRRGRAEMAKDVASQAGENARKANEIDETVAGAGSDELDRRLRATRDQR